MRLAVLVVFAVVSFVAAPAFGADTIESILARPVSPGTLAMLLQFSPDARVATRWEQALGSADPNVRAAAARLLYVSRAASTLPALRQALTTETNRGAAMEIARTVSALGGGPDDDLVLKAAARLPDSEIALVFAEERRGAGVPSVQRLIALKPRTELTDRIVAAVVDKNRDALNTAAATIVSAGDPDWWEALLNTALEEGLVIDSSLLESALHSSSPDIKNWTWWYVSATLARDPTAPLHVAAPERSAPEPNLSADANLGRELAARAMKQPAIPQTSLPAKPKPDWPTHPSFAGRELRRSLAPLLTNDERGTLEIELPSADALDVKNAGPPEWARGSMRTVGTLPAGFVTDVLKQTGCNRPKGDIAAAQVRFEDSKLAALQWVATPNLSPECTLAARAVIAASLLPSRAMLPGRDEFVALPMHDAFLQCLAAVERATEPPRPFTVGKPATPTGEDKILPPRKTRNVEPVYPPAAIQAHVQGIVILEAEISPKGCVRDIKVLRRLPMVALDAAALRAVSEWAFTPTLLNGVPVPVIMTVTVQFSLQ